MSKYKISDRVIVNIQGADYKAILEERRYVGGQDGWKVRLSDGSFEHTANIKDTEIVRSSSAPTGFEQKVAKTELAYRVLSAARDDLAIVMNQFNDDPTYLLKETVDRAVNNVIQSFTAWENRKLEQERYRQDCE